MKLVLLLAAVLCPLVTPVLVQAQPAEGATLAGVVQDTTGAVMAGVEVVLVLSDGEPRVMRTDGEGRFTFNRLPADTLTVTAAAAGFGDVTESVAIDEPVETITLVLQVALSERVEVISDLAAAGGGGLATTMMTGDAIEALPDDPGALLQRLRELAGATGAAGQVTITIDGFGQSHWMPPKQAIQAIRISSNWFAPEFAAPGQARVEIITKPGSAEVHGDLRLNLNDDALNARNAMAADDPQGHMRDITGFLSGAILPGRWSFVVYGGEWTQRENQVIAADILDSSHKAIRHAQTVGAPRSVANLWIGTNYQLTPLHTIATTITRTAETSTNLGLDTGIDLPSRAYGREAVSSAFRATVTSVPSMRLLNELRVQFSPGRTMTTAVSEAPAIIVLDAFNDGGNQDALFIDRKTRAVEAINSVTLYVPKHTLKAGAELFATRHHHTDRTNFGGTFLFGTTGEQSADGMPIDGSAIAPLENYRRTLLGLPGYGPSQFWIARGDAGVSFRDTTIGAYAQDDWMAGPRVTVSYGLRSDWQSTASQADTGARAGVTFGVDAERKNVIRAGAGVFFQRIPPELTLDALRFDGNHQQHLLIDTPAFFPLVPADVSAAAAVRPTVYVIDRWVRAPKITIAAVNYDRELMPGMFATARYSHEHGSRLLRNVALTGDVDNRVIRYESTGRLRRHELTAGWRWSARGFGQLFANYTLINGRGDTDGYSTSPADGARLEHEMGTLAGERRHQGNLGAHFMAPGAISVSPYLTAASGIPFNITTGWDVNGDGILSDRPVGVPRNAGREPGLLRVDLRVSRAFRSTMGAVLAAAASVENLFNTVNYEGVNGVLTSSAFGRPKRAGAPRRMTLSAGFSF